MQNPTSKRISCLSLTRAQEAQTPMTDNRTPIRLSALITEGDDWYRRIEQLTGVSTDLPLETLLEPLNLPYKVIDPIMTTIWGFHNAAVTAAFTAGLAYGLCPEKLLLEGGAC